VKKLLCLLVVLAILYALVAPQLAEHLRTDYRRVQITYPVSSAVLKATTCDQHLLAGQYLMIKVITFFGGVEAPQLRRNDYFLMFKNVNTAVKLDPYNIDAYYFAQAALTWEVGEYRAANDLLEYGMQYRSWDWYLPFFAAFNYSYFLHDFSSAARYYRKAAELSGSDLFMRLASRQLYEAGRTDEAIAYLKVMIRSAKKEALRRMLGKRLAAMVAVRELERARDAFLEREGRRPTALDELVRQGYLAAVPRDPYGGTFYLDRNGMVRSTSKFAAGGVKKGQGKDTQQ
jgi:hypothetical protein